MLLLHVQREMLLRKVLSATHFTLVRLLIQLSFRAAKVSLYSLCRLCAAGLAMLIEAVATLEALRKVDLLFFNCSPHPITVQARMLLVESSLKQKACLNGGLLFAHVAMHFAPVTAVFHLCRVGLVTVGAAE